MAMKDCSNTSKADALALYESTASPTQSSLGRVTPDRPNASGACRPDGAAAPTTAGDARTDPTRETPLAGHPWRPAGGEVVGWAGLEPATGGL